MADDHCEDRLLMLPREVSDLIWQALPPAQYCQCRCVSRAWKGRLSAAPDWTYYTRTGKHCTIVTDGRNPENCEARVWCHSGGTRLRLPRHADVVARFKERARDEDPRSRPRGDLVWFLTDVDEGFLCYRAWRCKEFHLAVYNPMTHSFTFAPLPTDGVKNSISKTKLVVDHEKKTFKIVHAGFSCSVLAIFDAATYVWRTFRRELPHMLRHSADFFVWKNVIYAYSKDFRNPDTFFAFDIDLLEGSVPALVEQRVVKLPGGQAGRRILHHKDEIVLVRHGPSYKEERREIYLEAWKWKGDVSSRRLDFSTAMWETLHIRRKILDIPEVNYHCLRQVCFGTGYMCFILKFDPKMFDHVAGDVDTRIGEDICVKYTFETGSCSVIAKSSIWTTVDGLFPWEPNVDPNVNDYTSDISRRIREASDVDE